MPTPSPIPTYDGPGDGFTITNPTLITSPTVFSGPTSCVVPLPLPFVCSGVYIDPIQGRVNWYGTHAVTQTYSDSFSTAPTNFLAPGNYAVIYPVDNAAGTPFSIVDNATSVTPEPSSIILFATGIFGIAVVMRRRYSRHRAVALRPVCASAAPGVHLLTTLGGLMSFSTRIIVLFAVLWDTVATTAHADTFTYGFFGGGGSITFSVTSPMLVSTTTIFTAGISCSYLGFQDCRSIVLDPVSGFATDDIFVHNQLGFSLYVPIPPTDFLAPGTYAIGGSSAISQS